MPPSCLLTPFGTFVSPAPEITRQRHFALVASEAGAVQLDAGLVLQQKPCHVLTVSTLQVCLSWRLEGHACTDGRTSTLRSCFGRRDEARDSSHSHVGKSKGGALPALGPTVSKTISKVRASRLRQVEHGATPRSTGNQFPLLSELVSSGSSNSFVYADENVTQLMLLMNQENPYRDDKEYDPMAGGKCRSCRLYH